MEYLLGIDGGGTKTSCLLTDGNGRRLAAAKGRGASHRHCGIEGVRETVGHLVGACLAQAGIAPQQLTGACFGLPLYGEDAAADAQLKPLLLALCPQLLQANDTEVGWAGSFAGGAGINVVSGTGSIAYGRDESGAAQRSGGWSEVFGDEGSSYWLGVRGMQLFTKQADGRAPRGALYTLVRDRWALQDDFEFAVLAHRDWLGRRDAVARFQKIVSDAADAGDAGALLLYEEAARELALQAQAVKQGLAFSAAPVRVSYSGGTFRAGEKLLTPFAAALRAQGMEVQPPLLGPVEGAVLLAAKQFAAERFAAVREGLLAGQQTQNSAP